jgi:NAD(P)H-dependent FMN reductase
MTPYKVGYLVGSLAKASINRLLATALVRLAPAELQMSAISFKDLPSTATTTTRPTRRWPPSSRMRSQRLTPSCS